MLIQASLSVAENARIACAPDGAIDGRVAGEVRDTAGTAVGVDPDPVQAASPFSVFFVTPTVPTVMNSGGTPDPATLCVVAVKADARPGAGESFIEDVYEITMLPLGAAALNSGLVGVPK